MGNCCSEGDEVREKLERGEALRTRGFQLIEAEDGVAFEKVTKSLFTGKGADRVEKECPAAVAEMMEDKDAEDTYAAFIQRVCEHRDCIGNLKSDEIRKAAVDFLPQFKKHGIDVYFCVKKERDPRRDRRREIFTTWITYVDRDENPSYVPKHAWDIHEASCSIM